MKANKIEKTNTVAQLKAMSKDGIVKIPKKAFKENRELVKKLEKAHGIKIEPVANAGNAPRMTVINGGKPGFISRRDRRKLQRHSK